jgi:hypothetical protein
MELRMRDVEPVSAKRVDAECVSGARGFSEPALQRPSARFMPTTQHALTLRRPPRPHPPWPRPPRPRPHPPGMGATRSRSG